MKKLLWVAVLAVPAIVLATYGFKQIRGRGNLPKAEPTPLPPKPIEQTIKERPFVSLILSNDGHWVTLEIKSLPKGTKGIDYDLIYLADFEGNKIERGVSTGGTPVELNGATEYSKKILFGSASCTTGVCKYKYDENVTEGTLILKLISDSGTEKYETAYRIQRGKEAKTDGFSPGDGAFSLTASALPANAFYITTSTVGVPDPLPSDVVPKSLPYGVFPSLVGKVAVSFKTSLTNPIICAFDGKNWQKLPTTVANGEATATLSGASIFILGQ